VAGGAGITIRTPDTHQARTPAMPDAGNDQLQRKETIMTQQTVRYEDIEKTPAQELLRLEHEQLDALIKEAERAAYRADTVVYWLRGIKVEKTFREAGTRSEGGSHDGL